MVYCLYLEEQNKHVFFDEYVWEPEAHLKRVVAGLSLSSAALTLLCGKSVFFPSSAFVSIFLGFLLPHQRAYFE